MNAHCECPRCGSRSLERMSSYSHCANCLYFEDYYEDSQSQVVQAVRIESELLEAAPEGENEYAESA